MFDSNILSFYQQEEFRKYPEDEQRAIIGNYFDRIVAPSLPASDEEKSVARTNFMEAHMLPRGVDPRALNLYADQKFVEKSPEEKADILGAFYDKLAGKSAQYLDPEVREQQRELFVAQNMLLPDDKGGWGSALIDAAKNLPHGVETTLRQAGRQIAVHSDDIPDIESISDLEDIRQNPEEYAERFNRERTKGTISADPNDSTNKAVREKQMRDEVYRAKYGHLENPVGNWFPLDPSGAQASAPYSATGALVGGLSLMGSAAAMPVAGIGNVILGASSKDQFLVDKLNQVNEFSRKFRGRPLDQEETDAVVAEYNLMGNQYGGIEALTELGSDFVFNRIAGRIFGKNAVKGALNKLGGFGLDAAGQHFGETWAEYGEGNLEHKAGLRNSGYSGGEGILQAFKAQAGTTNLMLGMTHGPVAAAEYTRSKFFSADKPVLDNINLKINSGETIGIIGGTGSSKSSLVQLIPRLYDVTSGEVKVGGVDVRDYDLETLRDSVAMVLQKNVLFSGTIKENLRWGNEKATDEELIHVCKLAQADDFVQTFPHKYDTYIEQGGNNVSGGQKQRLCIARALLKKPKILILDDSTSAVDTKTDALIRKAFLEEIPDTTKIIIAQRVSSVQDADHIIVMDDGKISAYGTHKELLKSSDIYREVYESQVKGGSDDEQ